MIEFSHFVCAIRPENEFWDCGAPKELRATAKVSLLLERYKALGAPLAHEDLSTERARRAVAGTLTWILGTYKGVADTLTRMYSQFHPELQIRPLVRSQFFSHSSMFYGSAELRLVYHEY